MDIGVEVKWISGWIVVGSRAGTVTANRPNVSGGAHELARPQISLVLTSLGGFVGVRLYKIQVNFKDNR